MTARTLLTGLALTAALAAPALADAPVDGGGADADADASPPHSTWYIEAGTSARWLGDTSAATLTPGVMFGPKVSVGHHLFSLPGPGGGMNLTAFARLGGGSTTDQIFQSLDTRIDQLALSGGGRLDLPLWRGVGAVAQLDVGTARTHAIVGDQLMDAAPVDDVAWGFIGTASIGATYERVFRQRFTVGIAIDVGYTVTSPVELHAKPRVDIDEDLSIPTVYESLGNLDTSGIVGSIALRAGF